MYPDFVNGGMIDVEGYKDGKRGGKVKIRTHIKIKDKKTLLIKDMPYGVTTTQLMDSIVQANDTGKIKIKKVVDNTASEIEIEVEVQLPSGVSPDITIDALYAFINCEISILLMLASFAKRSLSFWALRICQNFQLIILNRY